MPVLHTWSPEDTLLGVVAPLALALAAGTAIVIDLDVAGPEYSGEMTLARLVADGPRHDDLAPKQRGVAVLGNGGVAMADAEEVVAALVAGWPTVVFRLPPEGAAERTGVVPVLPVTPLTLDRGQAVYQRGPWPVPAPLEGVVLPRPRPSTIQSLLAGRRPGPSRWMSTWKRVWGLAWA